ncbi:MAG: anti-sigma factor [Melioribacteraceae bacterium]|nr:anti-sigma factor [Melioribacteraceae bacterium]
MADQIVHEMIAAFSVGCMDKQNFVQFKEYMQQDGDLPEGEMGELQNIVAMIPIILDIEIPHPSIKDKVAKRLIEIKDEIKAKIINERKSGSSTFSKTFTAPHETQDKFPSKQTKQQTQNFSPRLTNLNIRQTRTSKDDFAEYLEKRKTKVNVEDDFIPAPLPPAKEDTFEKIHKEPTKIITEKLPTQSKETVLSEETKPSSWIGILGIIISLLIFTILGYYSFINIQKLNNKVSELESQISLMKNQLSTTNSFVDNYSALIEFFNYKDISVYNLQSFKEDLVSSAKLLMSFNEKSGLIQFKNPKALPIGKTYQLWAVRRNQAISLGTFQPSGNEYLRITQFPPMPKEQIDYYKVTIESSEGATEPSYEIILSSQPNR